MTPALEQLDTARAAVVAIRLGDVMGLVAHRPGTSVDADRLAHLAAAARRAGIAEGIGVSGPMNPHRLLEALEASSLPEREIGRRCGDRAPQRARSASRHADGHQLSGLPGRGCPTPERRRHTHRRAFGGCRCRNPLGMAGGGRPAAWRAADGEHDRSLWTPSESDRLACVCSGRARHGSPHACALPEVTLRL